MLWNLKNFFVEPKFVDFGIEKCCQPLPKKCHLYRKKLTPPPPEIIITPPEISQLPPPPQKKNFSTP